MLSVKPKTVVVQKAASLINERLNVISEYQLRQNRHMQRRETWNFAWHEAHVGIAALSQPYATIFDATIDR